MKRYAITLVFISILSWRLVTGQTEKLVEGTRVRLTIPTIDYPDYLGNKTVIRRGEWEVVVSGYTEYIPGDVVVVEGVVDERGRVVEGLVLRITNNELRGSDYLLVQIARLRHWAVGRLQKTLPEPHASLAIGILLGVKRGMSREFYDQLVNTGTLHIVAASGYNVTVVAGVVLGLLGLILPKYLSLGVAILGVGLYVMLAGAGPAIVRAGAMGILSLIGIMLGRVREARWLLIVVVWLMLVVRPDLVRDVGFQLSVAATLGLLYLVAWMQKFEVRNKKFETIQKYAAEFLYPTLAATIATAPVIWWHFGRLSLIGILVNMLILPVVPVIMLLSALSVFATPLSYLLYVPLWWMVWVIRLFGG